MKLEWEYTGYNYQIPNIQDGFLYIGDWRISIIDLEKTMPTGDVFSEQVPTNTDTQ